LNSPANPDIIIASSLQKIFPDWQPVENKVPLTVLQNDLISFQVAARWKGDKWVWANIRLESEIPAAVRAVKLSPSAYPAPVVTDPGYERIQPGLFPDRLAALPEGRLPQGRRFKLIPGQFRALWIDVETNEEAGGVYPVRIIAEDDAGQNLFSAEARVEIIPVKLPEGKVFHTEWFHADCLADYYRVPVFSDEHFAILENFISAAVRRGINTLLMPLFTYPLDTGEGGARTTIQLVGVRRNKSSQAPDYAFDFTLLDRWVRMCERLGVRYFELSHLFSQWGAKYAPKIFADVDGVTEAIFGWHTPGNGAEYKLFLSAFLPELDQHLRALGIAERCFVHVSDEPDNLSLDAYREARQTVASLLKGYTIIDAISDIEFYQSGAAAHPIPAINKIEPFLDAKVPELWTYYCVSQSKDVSNRFFSMPLSRARILGVQLYKYRIEGFLHWGFNFYNSQLSLRHIDPYAVTDADEGFPSGDPFVVYPGPDGMPEESVRLMAMDAAFRDIRALTLLENLAGRQQVIEMIDRLLDNPTFTSYPYSDEPLLLLRRNVNMMIGDVYGKK